MNYPTLIRRYAPMLRFNPDGPVDRRALLTAILQVESSGGAQAEAARFEPRLIPAVKRAHPKAYRRYGDRLAASYGPFQILGVTAMELGMEGPPERLAQPEVGCFWAIEYLNRRLERNSHAYIARLDEAGQVRAIGDLYNSGNAADRIRPTFYMDRLLEAYFDAKKESAE